MLKAQVVTTRGLEYNEMNTGLIISSQEPP